MYESQFYITDITDIFSISWATSWENLFMPYANNKDADKPVRFLDSIIALVSLCEISIL